MGTLRRRRALLFVRLVLGAAAAGAIATSIGVLWLRATLLDPAHVRDTLRAANAAAYVREHALPSWLDGHLRELGVEDTEARRFAGGVLREVVTERGVRDRIDAIVNAVLPWTAGDADELTIRPRLDEWALEAPHALARLSFPSWLVDSVLVPKLEAAAAALRAAPLSMQLGPEEPRALAHEIAPPAWIDAQVVGATYAVARWAVGAQRTFEIRIDYRDRVPLAAAAFERLLRRSAVESVLLERIVVPTAVEALAAVPPFAEHGVEPAEVVEAVPRLAPDGWLEDQAAAAIHAIGAWLSGRDEELALTIDTGALRDAAGWVIASVARATAGVDASDEEVTALATSMRARLPEVIIWGDAELRAAIGEGAHERLRWLRSAIVDGFRYDQDDLRHALREGPGLTDAEIDALRAMLGEGFVYTERDLRGARLGLPLERTLSSLRVVMVWDPLPLVLAPLLLVALALVSGPTRSRRGRFVLLAIAVGGLVAAFGLTTLAAALLDAHVLGWAEETGAARAFGERLRGELSGSIQQLGWIGAGCAACALVPLAIARLVRRRV